jgi:hypothetical protein
MRERKLPDYDILDTPEDEPIVLVGQPDALYGEVKLRNPGDRSVILRETRLHGTPLMTGQVRARKTAESSEPIQQAISTVVLRPGQTQHVPLNVSLSAHTPPGEYRGEIEVAGRKRPVIYHITEMLSLEISPTQLVIENHPGETFTKQMVISNTGNVPLNIGEFGPVILDVEFLECIVGRAAVAQADQFETMDRYYLEQVRQTKRVNEATGILRVRNTSGPTILEPGEVRSFDLQIRVPERLEKRFRYFGVVPIYTENLLFVLVPATGEAIVPKPEPAPRTRSKKSSG